VISAVEISLFLGWRLDEGYCSGSLGGAVLRDCPLCAPLAPPPSRMVKVPTHHDDSQLFMVSSGHCLSTGNWAPLLRRAAHDHPVEPLGGRRTRIGRTASTGATALGNCRGHLASECLVVHPQRKLRRVIKFTGKERDAETGLDYFGARYMSSAQGRFTSPDAPLLDQHPADPQSWNLYSYTRSNPLRYVDPTGNVVELVGDEAERDRILKAARQAVGSAGRYLEVQAQKDKDGKETGRHVLGWKKGFDAKKEFASNQAAEYLSDVMGDKSVVRVALAKDWTSVDGNVIGPAQVTDDGKNFKGGGTPGVHSFTENRVYLLDSQNVGSMASSYMSDGKPGVLSPGIVLLHELGHAASSRGLPTTRGFSYTGAALLYENAARRQVPSPFPPWRTKH
jgi:RHS repeat-associated protein